MKLQIDEIGDRTDPRCFRLHLSCFLVTGVSACTLCATGTYVSITGELPCLSHPSFSEQTRELAWIVRGHAGVTESLRNTPCSILAFGVIFFCCLDPEILSGTLHDGLENEIVHD